MRWGFPTTAKGIAIGLLLSTVLFGPLWEAYISHRQKLLTELLNEACNGNLTSNDPKQPIDAISKLRGYSDKRVDIVLMRIVLGQCPTTVTIDAKETALEALATRPDPQASVTVARLLQPQQDLATRENVADVLAKTKCNLECNAYVLEYLERVSQGEPNLEDYLIEGEGADDDVTKAIAAEQQTLYAKLGSVLQRDKSQTLENLETIYGLGGLAPSAFAVQVVSRLGLKEACPLLAQSARELKLLDSKFFQVPRRRVEDTIATLRCR
jgi:hypothetical protein